MSALLPNLPKPWYPGLNVSSPSQPSQALEQPLLPGSSYCFTFYGTPVSSYVNLHLANSNIGSDLKNFIHVLSLHIQNMVQVKLKYSTVGQLFYSMNGIEDCIQPRGLNFERPLFVFLELHKCKFDVRSSNDAVLLYMENVHQYHGAEAKADTTPGNGRLSFHPYYELMELLQNHNTRKAFVDGALMPGTRYKISVMRILNTAPSYCHIYLTNSSPNDVNKGEIILIPFDMTYRFDNRLQSECVVRHSWNGGIACGRDSEPANTDERLILKEKLNLDKPLFVLLELCNLSAEVTCLDDADAAMVDVMQCLGGGPSKPPGLRNAQCDPPPIERVRPRVRFMQGQGANGYNAARMAANGPRHVQLSANDPRNAPA